MKFFSDIRLILLAIWLGAAVFFIAAAQGAFAIVADRELAGSLVGRNLLFLNLGGVTISIVLLLTSWVGTSTVNKLWLWIERLLLLVLGAACAVSQFVLAFWMSSIKAQLSAPIDQVATDDPLRIKFDTLHQYSEWVLVAAMAAALITCFIISNRKFGAAKSGPADVYDFSKEFKI